MPRRLALLKMFSLDQAVDGMKASFSSLKGSPRDLWVIFAIKLIESLAYFSKSIVFTILLSEPKPKGFGFSDSEAGLYYGMLGSLTTVFGLLVGPLIDKLGCRSSLIVGAILSLLSRVGIAMATSTWVLWISAFVLMPVGSALMIPVMTLAVKGYTNTTNRGFAFGLFYSIMNVGALMSGLLVDAFTLSMGDSLVLGMSPSRWVFMVGAICSALCLVLTLFVLKEVRIHNLGPEHRFKAWQTTKDLLQMRSFWRFVAFTLITVNLKSIFRHLDATLPKYLLREHGPNVPKGTIYSINPFMIIFLVPVVSAMTSRYEHFTMIHVGSYVSAASVFVLALSSSIPAAIFFVVILSLGEALWSPRFYDYTVSVAPEGKEGTFMAMSSAPLFVATLPTGLLSGYLLEKYCPETGPRNSGMMWLIIGLVTATSPVLITLTERWVREPTPRGGGKGDSDDGDSERGIELGGMGGGGIGGAGGGGGGKGASGHSGRDEDEVRMLSDVGLENQGREGGEGAGSRA